MQQLLKPDVVTAKLYIMEERKNVYQVYNKIGDWFAENRPKNLMEKKYLDQLIALLPLKAEVLDLGCGTGEPIFGYLLDQDFQVTGLDESEKMIALAKENFPHAQFIKADMRSMSLNKKFDAIIAWHSFFHLPAGDQPNMFNVFKDHLNPGGVLIFTSGTNYGEAWGMNGGENLFHASLDTETYQTLLDLNGFKVLTHVANDPECGNATVWVAQQIVK